jgi:YesN/AraC family two-component response regulator
MADRDYSARRFLIVDDETFMLGMLERTLRQFKAGAIVKAHDGAEALKSIKDNLSQVDCIIADFNMKPVNGLQLLQAVRMGVNPRIPRDQSFIMLTGHGETDVVKAAIMLDVNGYLVKPVAPDKLAQALDRAFKKPTELKEAAYYRGVHLGAAEVHNDADVKGPKAWVILAKQAAPRADQALRAKIDQFRKDHATRDGIEEIRIKNRRQCDLGELKEDMILAEDVEAEEGVILLRKGTHLTARMVDRLREIAVESKSRDYVWIGDLAG